MSLKPQTSFSSGELDPILHDRVTLERFQNALATARNVMVTKVGTIMSRFSTFFFRKTFSEDRPVRIYSPPNSGMFLELGTIPNEFLPAVDQEYIKLYALNGTLLHYYDSTTAGNTFYFRQSDLPKLHFVPSGDYVYIFKGYSEVSLRYFIAKVKLTPTYGVTTNNDPFELPTPPGSPSTTITSNASGYAIDYAYAAVVDGQEVFHTQILASANPTLLKKPISATEKITLEMRISTSNDADLLASINEVRIYQRPSEGSSYGFLGRTTNVYISGSEIKAKFVDLGANPDYSNGLQSLVTKDGIGNKNNVGLYDVNTGVVYQQRLILGNFLEVNDEAIVASRPGYQNNFYRDFPISADSSLNFKAGTSGKARVLRMIDSDGLVVFTSIGVFVSVGVLSPDNLALTKRGNWVIDEDLPPLAIPGGLFFVDKTTSTVRQLVYSQELSSYDSVDQSIFSGHLFENRTIKSWAFQEGVTPMIIVVFSDGTFATFTYSFEHQMKAWTRHDSFYPIEQVEGTGIADTTIFVINKNGERYIEMSLSRIIPPSVYATNTEAHLLAYSAFMDGLKIKIHALSDNLSGTDVFELTPVVADDWEGPLVLTCGTSTLFPDLAEFGAVGTIFRFFNPKDKTAVDLEVISRVDENEITVQPSDKFPEEYAVGFKMYLTHNIVDELEHLEGEEVAVLSDGYVISSPYNDSSEDTMSILTVIGGEIQFSNDYRSAITIVGRPIAADIKTLNISTVEQSPTAIESLTANKLYVRLYESRGIFVDNQFPENLEGEVDGTSVKGMQTLDTYPVPSNAPILGNRAKPAMSKRIEVTLPGEWDSNGQMAFRQVDPLHFEILSIIADVEILKRSDR